MRGWLLKVTRDPVIDLTPHALARHEIFTAEKRDVPKAEYTEGLLM